MWYVFIRNLCWRRLSMAFLVASTFSVNFSVGTEPCKGCLLLGLMYDMRAQWWDQASPLSIMQTRHGSFANIHSKHFPIDLIDRPLSWLFWVNLPLCKMVETSLIVSILYTFFQTFGGITHQFPKLHREMSILDRNLVLLLPHAHHTGLLPPRSLLVLWRRLGIKHLKILGHPQTLQIALPKSRI